MTVGRGLVSRRNVIILKTELLGNIDFPLMIHENIVLFSYSLGEGAFMCYPPSSTSDNNITQNPTSSAYVAPRSEPCAWVSGIISSEMT